MKKKFLVSLSFALVLTFICTIALASNGFTIWQIGVPDGDVNPIQGSSEYPATRAFDSVFNYTIGDDPDPIDSPSIPGLIGPQNVCDIVPEGSRPCTDATERLNITFNLECDYDPDTLSVVYDRYGSETDLVYLNFDGTPIATITGSGEGTGSYQSHTIALNPSVSLNSGDHTLSFEYAGGGAGNGHYIDYLKLVSNVECIPNQPPVANPNGPYFGDEGSLISLDGTGSSDPDGDPLNYAWSVDSPLCTFDDATSPTPELTCADNGSFTVTLMVGDGQASDSDTTNVTVNNVAPTLGAITTDPVDPVVAVGTSIDFSADFTDPGVLDTHTAVWDWDVGNLIPNTSDGLVTQGAGFGSVDDNHTYTEPGVYTVSLTVTDNDDDSDTANYQYVVVYDPSAGFVTGGGWINSPARAYTADPSLTGKATFGFVSKYKKGATTPTGNTQFQFKAADLNFHSDAYQWLVIALHKAMYKGTGTINGEGNYGFMLSATDAKLHPVNTVDTFRIKIWDIDDGDSVVYDNQVGYLDFSDPSMEIGGGSIVIHSGK